MDARAATEITGLMEETEEVTLDDMISIGYSIELPNPSYNCRTFAADVLSGAALFCLAGISAGMGAGFGAEAGMLSSLGGHPPIFTAGLGFCAGAAGAIISTAADNITGCYMAGAAVFGGMFSSLLSVSGMAVMGEALTSHTGAAFGGVLGGTTTLITSLITPRCTPSGIVNPNNSILTLGRRMFGLYQPPTQPGSELPDIRTNRFRRGSTES